MFFFQDVLFGAESKIDTFIQQKWQKCWINNTNIKLLTIKPILEEWKQISRKGRKKNEVTLTRIHIGHIFLNDPYLLKNEV